MSSLMKLQGIFQLVGLCVRLDVFNVNRLQVRRLGDVNPIQL